MNRLYFQQAVLLCLLKALYYASMLHDFSETVLGFSGFWWVCLEFVLKDMGSQILAFQCDREF